jgi:RNA polymerase sigma factor (sigma-70 family)
MSSVLLQFYPFCYTVVDRYHPRPYIRQDLAHEGIFGIPVAVRKFDDQRGYKFITYAYWWILDYVRNALNNEVRHCKHHLGYEELDPDSDLITVNEAAYDHNADLINEILKHTNLKLGTLSTKIMHRYYRDGWTDSAIAAALGTSSRWASLVRRQALDALKAEFLAKD